MKISPSIFTKKKPTEKLILTLLVKNEADIILDNIFFHYAKGVDFIIVTDNNSTDGTIDILKDLEKAGLIHLLTAKIYIQDKLVNRMGQIAKDVYGATILIHSDADEFWQPIKRSKLIPAFLDTNQESVLVDRKDVLPTVNDRDKSFPQNNLNMVTKHLISEDVERDSKDISLFLYRLPPKVMFSVKDSLKNVGIGNHELSGDNSGNVTNEIIIYHFPFKSSDRFIEKVKIAGKTLEEVKTPKTTAWHWKRWHKQYKSNDIEKEIELLIPDLNTIKGIEFKDFNYNENIIKPIMSNRVLKKKYKYFMNAHAKVIKR